jgi:hypothetical protein
VVVIIGVNVNVASLVINERSFGTEYVITLDPLVCDAMLDAQAHEVVEL